MVRAQLPVYVAFPFDRAEHLRGVRRSKPQHFAQLPAGETSGFRKAA
nr:MAG TPA: hypothetical protein [Caudoviricetes sp.]